MSFLSHNPLHDLQKAYHSITGGLEAVDQVGTVVGNPALAAVAKNHSVNATALLRSNDPIDQKQRDKPPPVIARKDYQPSDSTWSGFAPSGQPLKDTGGGNVFKGPGQVNQGTTGGLIGSRMKT